MRERLTDWVKKSNRRPPPTPTLLLTLAAALGLGVLSLWFAAIDYRTAMFISYFTHPLILVLNLLPVLLLVAIFFLATRRSSVAFGLSSVVVLGLTFVNWYKLRFRDDPFLFEDILLIKEAGNMAGNYQLTLSKSMLLAIVLVVAGVFVLHFFAPWRPSKDLRLVGVTLALMGCIPVGMLMRSETIYKEKTDNFDLVSPWSATGTYQSKGFLYPFLHSIFSAADLPPQGYDEAQAKALLAAYEDGHIPEDQKVDILGIMLEAYNDFSRMGVPGLNPEVYEYFHQLEDESLSGSLVTNIFAGGTVDTERAFLTGFANQGSLRTPTNSYPWYFREQGYQVEGDHPCYEWFYNRKNINANLGFERYRFVENYYRDITGDQPGTDGEFFSSFIPRYLDTIVSSEQPYFNFSVTYQGHGPYDTEQLWWGDGWVDRLDYTDQEYNILNNYFGSLYNTNQLLETLVDTLRESDRPVVLVLFGDHNPWLGDGNSVYHKLGIELDFSTEEGFLNYYSTRYLIWANPAAKEALGRDISGTGPSISPNFLMNQVFEACGWDGPAYLQAISPVADRVPVLHTSGRFVENGLVTDTLTPEGQALAEDYRNLEYYWRKNFSY